MQSKKFNKIYIETLHRMANDLLTTNTISELKKEDAKFRSILKSEFPLVHTIDFNHIRKRTQIKTKI